MKEMIGNALNVVLHECEDGTLSALGEIVIVVCEPTYSIDAGGDMNRRREAESFRFGVGIKSLRALIKNFEDYALEMEKLEGTFTRKIPAENQSA